MRRAVGYLSAFLSCLAIAIYLAALAGVASIRTSIPMFWALNIAAILTFVGAQYVLLHEDRSAKLNIRVLKDYLSSKLYRWVVAAFWVFFSALLISLALLPTLSSKAQLEQSGLAVFELLPVPLTPTYAR